MLFNESDVTSAEKIFARNAKSNLIIVDTLVRNGSKGKERMLADFVLVRSKTSTKNQSLLFELFVRNQIAKI